MKKLMAGVAFSCVAVVVQAETGVWINTTKSEQAQDWLKADNWQDGYVPTNVMDSADLSTVYPAEGSRFFGVTQLPYRDCTWDAFVDTSMRRRLVATYDGGKKLFPVYSIHDLSSYLGRFAFGWPFTLQFCASTVLHNLCANNQPIVGVTNAAYTVVASNFYNRGWVKKTGPGVLRYDSWSGEKTGVKMAGGSLELLGAADTLDDSQPTASPYFWFDASETNKMTLVEGEDGVINVTWWEAKSYLSSAHAQHQATPIDGVPTPRLVKGGPNGWLVDFGARLNTGTFGGWTPDTPEKQAELQEKYGIAAGLQLENNNQINDYFVVYIANDPTRTPVTMGSKENNGYFSPPLTSGAYSPFFLDSETTTALRSGEVRIDGNRMSYQETHEVAGLHVAFATGGKNRVSAFGFAFRHGMRGGMKLAEVIAYNRDLTPDERRATIRYLMKRWCRGVRDDRAQDWDLGAIALEEDATISVDAGRTAKVREIASSVDKSLTVSGGGTLAVEQLGAPPKGTNADGKSAGASPIPVTVANGTLRLLKPLYTGDATAALPYDDALVYHLDASDVNSYEATDDGKVAVWNDTRTESTRRVAYAGEGATPTLKEKALNGLNMLSTGSPANNGNAGYFHLQDNEADISDSTAYCVEAFVVFAQPLVAGKSFWAMTLGSRTGGNIDFEPIAHGRLIGGRFTRSTGENNAAQPAGWFALNGTQVSPDVYNMIREPVVYSAHLHAPQRVSALARRGDNGSGGIDYGEILLYNRELAPGERRNIEAYLLRKWFDREHPSALPQRVGTTVVASTGAIVLDDGTALDVTGDLSVDGGALAFGVSTAETAPKLVVSGALTIADGSTIRISTAATEMPASGRIVLAKAASLTADPSTLTVDAPAALSKGTLKVVGGELRWQAPSGMLILFR